MTPGFKPIHLATSTQGVIGHAYNVSTSIW